jgi:hypothetical protein
MVFYILIPHRIEAFENYLSDFLADDILCAIQDSTSKIATDTVCLANLQEEYPNYYKYEIRVGKL